MHGVVQLAPFHPSFQFQGTEEADIDNLTNRAPYPSFHILREDEVSSAVQKLKGDSSKVWNRNVRLLQNLQKTFGRQKAEKIMKGDEVDGIDQVLRDTKEEVEKEYDT
uniref:Uncharacterized protein n=1 Tax=Ditylum brightwellii TaxID=49249 RepID=A0A7S2EIU0_9STRA